MLKIGPLEFDFPVVQAALAGYSDTAMRLIARRLGAPYAMQEVMLDKSVVHPGKVQRRILDELHPDDHPIGGQLMGSRPEEFAVAAAMMANSGYDVIDINFGCPVKKVLGRQRGGFLLHTPQMAISIMQAVRQAVPNHVPVTIKMRRGMDDTPSSEQKFFEIFEAALELGLDAITIHPRTVEQRYRGYADWDFLARVKRMAGARVILGSGDLFSADDIVRMFEATGVDGVTLARGCIGYPWLFADARAALAGRPLPDPPTVAEQRKLIRDHYNLSIATHGERLGTRMMRKFGIKYAELHPFPKEVRAAFVDAFDAASWFAAWERWYDPSRDWPMGRRKSGPQNPRAAALSA